MQKTSAFYSGLSLNHRTSTLRIEVALWTRPSFDSFEEDTSRDWLRTLRALFSLLRRKIYLERSHQA